MTRDQGVLRRLLSASLVPRTRVGRNLALIALVDSVGSGMFYSGSALYFTQVVGLTAAQVGLGLSLAGLVGFGFAVPIGMAADRLRAGRVYVALQLWRGVCYAAYCFTGSFPMFVIAACGIGLADTAVPPISQAVVGAAVSAEDRVDTLAKVRAVRNIGFGAGALIATAAIQQGSKGAFVSLIAGNAVSFVIAAVLLFLAGVTRLVTTGPGSSRRPSLVADVRYVVAAALNGLLAVHLTLLPVALPLWISLHTRVPIAIFGFLYLLNTVLAVTLQARFARPAERLVGAVRCEVLAGLSLAGFGVAAHLMGAVSLVWLAVGLAVAAAILLTFGELWQSAGGWTISYELARPDRRAQYLSTFQLGTSLQAIVAPWLITNAVLPSSGGWLAFAVVIAMAGFAVAAVVDPRLAPGAAGEPAARVRARHPGTSRLRSRPRLLGAAALGVSGLVVAVAVPALTADRDPDRGGQASGQVGGPPTPTPPGIPAPPASSAPGVPRQVAGPGGLDPAFGRAGTAVLAWPGDLSGALAGPGRDGHGVSVEPRTGRILVTGTVRTRTGYQVGLARLTPDGQLDRRFGSRGYALAATDLALHGNVLVQPDGRILVAGAARARSGEPRGLGVVRYLPGGKPDPAFGRGGARFLDFPDRPVVTGAVRQRDGKLVFAARYARHVGLIRLNPNGTLDPTFGVRGRVRTAFHASDLHDLLLQPDGRLVVAGETFPSARDRSRPSAVFLIRYLPNGGPDRTFGTGGRVVKDVNGRAGQTATAVALQPDGSLVVAGHHAGPPSARRGTAGMLVRFTRTGQLDSGFGRGGVVSHNPRAGSNGVFTDVVPRGRHLLVVTLDPGKGAVGVVRYDGGTGALDSAFGSDGMVRLPRYEPGVELLDAGPQGKTVLVAGYQPAGKRRSAAVQRYRW